MFLKKVLNQPNIVGTVMIALLLGAGFVYAFAFDGFNVETVPGGKVEAWLAQAYACNYDCSYELCPAKEKNTGNCNNCSKKKFCKSCYKTHKCKDSGGCPYLVNASGGCSNYSSQKKCPKSCSDTH